MKTEWDFQEDRIVCGNEMRRAFHYGYKKSEVINTLINSIKKYIGYNNLYNGQINPSTHSVEGLIKNKKFLVIGDRKISPMEIGITEKDILAA